MAQGFCGKCGNGVQPKDRFYRNCGSPLDSKDTSTIQSPSKYPRDYAASAFAMEPRKTMAELITAGRAELRTCRLCHKKTPFPINTPPCAIALVCQNCGAPLMPISSELDYVRSELVNSAFGYHNRGLLHVNCPWCNKKNYAITTTANSIFMNYYVCSEPQNPQALFAMQVDCVHCNNEFWIEWRRVISVSSVLRVSAGCLAFINAAQQSVHLTLGRFACANLKQFSTPEHFSGWTVLPSLPQHGYPTRSARG